MDAHEFMQGHADKACAGRIPEVVVEATPEAIEQARDAMAGFPYPPKSNKVVDAGIAGEHAFDVTYTGDGGERLTIREWVQQDGEGEWKIVRVEKPSYSEQ
jgi:hypothetical protein